jgi:hypothetical protein
VSSSRVFLTELCTQFIGQLSKEDANFVHRAQANKGKTFLKMLGKNLPFSSFRSRNVLLGFVIAGQCSYGGARSSTQPTLSGGLDGLEDHPHPHLLDLVSGNSLTNKKKQSNSLHKCSYIHYSTVHRLLHMIRKMLCLVLK